MKKLMICILACLLLACAILTTACGEPPKPVVAENTTWRIVYGEGSGNKKLAVRIQEAILKVVSVEVPVLSDETPAEEGTLEILVGKTNRACSEGAYARIGGEDILITGNGKCVAIAAQGSGLLSQAVDQFLVKYVGFISEKEYAINPRLSFKGIAEVLISMKEPEKVALLQLDSTATYVNNLKVALEVAGFDVSVGGINTVLSSIFDYSKYKLVVIAGASVAPNGIKDAILGYMEDGGRVLFLGGPVFETELYQYNGEWLEKEEYVLANIKNLAATNVETLVDTSKANTANAFVPNASKVTNNKITHTIGNYGLAGSAKQLYIHHSDYYSWAHSKYTVKSTTKNANAIGFWAKADANTDHVNVGATTNDGTKWMTTVRLTTEWKYYLLGVGDFTADGNTKMEIKRVSEVQFGFADSRQDCTKGEHGFYIADVQRFVVDEEFITTVARADTDFAIDGIAPLYELYPITNAADLVTEDNQVYVTDRDYIIPDSLFSCHPARQGTGFGKTRTSRFVPLIRVNDEKGLHSGYAAWITMFSSLSGQNKELENSMVGCFSASTNDFYNAAGIAAVVEAATAMTRDVYLLEGGTDEYTYIPVDEPDITMGGILVAYDKDLLDRATLSVALYQGDTLVKELSSASTKLRTAGRVMYRINSTLEWDGKRPDRAVTTLTLDGQVIDQIEHDINYWEAKPESERKYVYTENGYFMQDGKRITLFGINYYPSSGMAEPNGTYTANFTMKAAYDPDVIYRDLQRIKEIGFNAVNMSLHGANVDSNNMLDVICMCEELGLYVDLAIRSNSGYYSEFIYYSSAHAQALLVPQHFAENDTIIAYDICWERRVGPYDPKTYDSNTFSLGRKRWDPQWREWIADMYGSIEHAEELWGCKAPRDAAGDVIGLSDAVIDAGPKEQAAMIAAYYRFIDDMVAKEFNDLVSYLKTLDPNHLYSFRMSMAGSGYDGGALSPHSHCYDFRSLASTMDIMEPEGYALIENNEIAMQQVIYAHAYSRYVAPDTPLIWKEFSASNWNGSNFTPNESLLEMCAVRAGIMLEHMYQSECAGIYYWWYSAGYRLNEDSDCGVNNPDGSDRPVTKVFREYATKFLSMGERSKPDVLIELERDDHTRSIFDMFTSVQDQLLAAYKEGKTVAFIDKQQDAPGDVYYADETLGMATGDSKAEGQYSLRYVNGQIQGVTMRKENGVTYADVTIVNTQSSTWRANTVSIISEAGDPVTVEGLIGVEVAPNEKTVVTVKLTGKGKCTLCFEIGGIRFGMDYAINVQ